MKHVVVVLALGAIVWPLAPPLGAAMWGELRLAGGCSPDACYCPHGNRIDRAARRNGRHHHGRHHHDAEQHRQGPAQDPDHCHHTAHSSAAPTPERSHTGDRCELRRCGSESSLGTGIVALPDGDFSASPTLPIPAPGGPPGLVGPTFSLDVYAGIELPPPRH